MVEAENSAIGAAAIVQEGEEIVANVVQLRYEALYRLRTCQLRREVAA